MEIRISDLLFVDFEASSLSVDSWPIEVGLSWLEAGEVMTWSTLIRPDPSWPESDWSIASQGIHNIRRPDLDAAPKAAEVAIMLRDRLAGKHGVSDSPSFELRWANRLMQTQGLCAAEFLDFDAVAAAAAGHSDHALDCIYEKLRLQRVPHRAGPDARRMAVAVKYGLDAARKIAANPSEDVDHGIP